MAPIATHRALSASAHDRLRRQVLFGVAIAGMLTGAAGAVISIADGAIDPRVVGLYAPDILIGIAIVWQLLARVRVDTVVDTYAAYLVLRYAFFALHERGYEVFTTPWVLMPPVFGFYLGGRRLGAWLTVTIVGEGLLAVVVHVMAIGHHLLELPPSADAGAQVMTALGIAELLCLVYVFERRRERLRAELDDALGDLDDADSALRKTRGQLLDAARRSGIAESAAALLHTVGNALHGATVASAAIADQAAGLRVDNFHRAVDEIERGALEQSGDRAMKLRAYLRGLANHLTERKTQLVDEARSLQSSIDSVAAALSTQLPRVEPPQVLDDVATAAPRSDR